jgi:crotonobetainyl-CoA:carnitine CoA-transferase CaiB-like acyl-CoA transferase
MGQPPLATDARFLTARDRKAHEDELDNILTAWTAQRDKWEVTRTLQAAGVAAFPSMTTKDIAEDQHLEARGFFVRLSHPEVGVRTNTGIPWALAHSPNNVRSPAPLLGQHTDQVMRDVLGYSTQKIAELKEQKILD